LIGYFEGIDSERGIAWRGGERVERSFAHTYDTGGMRRTDLRRAINILKRVLVHASASISVSSCGDCSVSGRRAASKAAWRR
jgi:hypothetical protein